MKQLPVSIILLSMSFTICAMGKKENKGDQPIAFWLTRACQPVDPKNKRKEPTPEHPITNVVGGITYTYCADKDKLAQEEIDIAASYFNGYTYNAIKRQFIHSSKIANTTYLVFKKKNLLKEFKERYHSQAMKIKHDAQTDKSDLEEQYILVGTSGNIIDKEAFEEICRGNAVISDESIPVQIDEASNYKRLKVVLANTKDKRDIAILLSRCKRDFICSEIKKPVLSTAHPWVTMHVGKVYSTALVQIGTLADVQYNDEIYKELFQDAYALCSGIVDSKNNDKENSFDDKKIIVLGINHDKTSCTYVHEWKNKTKEMQQEKEQLENQEWVFI